MKREDLKTGVLVRCLTSAPVKIFLWILVSAASLQNIALLSKSISPDGLCRRDLFQDYLQATAVRDGLDPFLSLNSLAQRYAPQCSNEFFPHPSPHTLVQLLISLPLSVLGERPFALLWLAGSIAALIFASYKFYSFRPDLGTLLPFVGVVFILFTSRPVLEDIFYGQTGLFVLALLAAAFIRISRGAFLTGGALVGLSIALKPIAWLCAPLLLLRKPKAGLSAVFIFMGLQAVCAAVFGLSNLIRYYRDVPGAVLPWWSSSAAGVSLWSVIGRILNSQFIGWVGGGAQTGIAASIIVLGLAISGLIWACRAEALTIALARALAISPLFLPLAWVHYLSVYPLVFACASQSGVGGRGEPGARGILAAAFLFWWISIPPFPEPRVFFGVVPDALMALAQLIPTICLVWALSFKDSDGLSAPKSERPT